MGNGRPLTGYEPAAVHHVDYTLKSGPQRVRDVLGEAVQAAISD